jgi:PAS domain S-box-containing protein
MTSRVPLHTRTSEVEPLGLPRGRRSVRSSGGSRDRAAAPTDGKGAKVQGLSDDRYRSIINSLDIGFCIVEMKFDGFGSPVDYKFVEVNDAFVHQTGLHDAAGKWMRTLAPEHEQHWFDIYGKVALTGEAVRFENKADALNHRWYDVHAFPVGPSENRQVGIIFNDITSRKNAERQQALLVHELSHRMKNTMTMVQAIASQTLGHMDREAIKAFTNRLQSLSRAHDVLLKQNWSSANLSDVVRGIAGTYAEPARFELSGPEVNLNPNAALSISLLLHELATNAVKHGALSVPEGVVHVIWSADDAVLVLNWLENGGPAAPEPRRSGSGSRLINQGIVGTKDVKKLYSPLGFRAVFRAPINLVKRQE